MIKRPNDAVSQAIVDIPRVLDQLDCRLMRKYRVVIFDLFDTLINFNRSTLPETHVGATTIRSTGIGVYCAMTKLHPKIDFSHFLDAFRESYIEFTKKKDREHREFHNKERFKILLDKMNLTAISDSDELLESMVSAHMEGIASAMEFPAVNMKTLLAIKNKNPRLAIISNFDHAPTAHALLDKFGIKEYFEKTFISVDIGWRKPRPEIFKQALYQLRVKPEETIFIGDNFEADIVGSKGVGMDAIWINKNLEPLRQEGPSPDFMVSRFSELGELFQ